ncbi:hypothetical protein GJ496_003569 [Pomphorhynchus laevis]|nr:hypothetical protein GJ496_003569 [Pomphorhynchus laevis]
MVSADLAVKEIIEGIPTMHDFDKIAKQNRKLLQNLDNYLKHEDTSLEDDLSTISKTIELCDCMMKQAAVYSDQDVDRLIECLKSFKTIISSSLDTNMSLERKMIKTALESVCVDNVGYNLEIRKESGTIDVWHKRDVNGQRKRIAQICDDPKKIISIRR